MLGSRAIHSSLQANPKCHLQFDLFSLFMLQSQMVIGGLGEMNARREALFYMFFKCSFLSENIIWCLPYKNNLWRINHLLEW